MNDCKKEHRYLERYQNLPYSQECVNNKRHKCAGCAYVLGVKDALNGLDKRNVLLDNLPNSQAQTKSGTKMPWLLIMQDMKKVRKVTFNCSI